MEITVSTILTFLGGIISKLIYDFISGSLKRKKKELKNEIDWHNELINLCKSIQIDILLHKQNFESFSIMEDGQTEFDEYEEEYEQLIEMVPDIENFDQVLKEEHIRQKDKYRNDVSSNIREDMGQYQNQVKSLLLDGSVELEDDLVENMTHLVQELNSIKAVGYLDEDVVKSVHDRSNQIISLSEHSKSNLKGTSLIK